jgi:hypothetical protein
MILSGSVIHAEVGLMLNFDRSMPVTAASEITGLEIESRSFS